MNMRETLKTREFYSKIILKKDNTIGEFSNPPPHSQKKFEISLQHALILNYAYQKKLIAMYSRGDAVEDMKSVYLEFLRVFKTLVACAGQGSDYIQNEWVQTLDEYYRIMSWAILLDVDLEQRKEFVLHLDFFGQQKVGDMLLQKAGLLDREPVDRLGGRSAYEPLLEALQAETSLQQEEKLKQFLNHWYGALKKMNVAWIDDHRSEHDVHFGYWCFEAAAAVKVLQLDPEAFRGMPYFPYDLVKRVDMAE